jgi:ElaB/YqjD/DUF883 family membrane-anchored ribosome-binding protein
VRRAGVEHFEQQQKGRVMADNDLQPITDGDITPPPASTDFTPAEPLKTAGVEFDPATTGSKTEQAKQTVKDYSSKYGAQATDKIRTLADTGKERAVGGLDQLSQMINDAAAQVDDKLGAQYGEYARSAAGAVSNFSEQIKGKQVDELLDDARVFVRKSPGVAVGVAAALGFAVARLVQSGIDANGGVNNGSGGNNSGTGA